jgi:hypothetical protein
MNDLRDVGRKYIHYGINSKKYEKTSKNFDHFQQEIFQK